MQHELFRCSQVLAVLVLILSCGLQIETAQADDFQVNTYTTGGQFGPSVAVGANGDFVVVWTSLGSAGTDLSETSVQGRLFNSLGAPVGDDFQINTYTPGDQSSPRAVASPGGDFVVVWHALDGSGTDGSGTSIQGRRYDSAGTPLGGQFQVNTYTTAYQYSPKIEMDAKGGFYLVWHSGFSDSPDPLYEVRGRLYDSSGSPLGEDFQFNSYTTDSQNNPSIAAAADGDFVAVWQSVGSAGSDSSASSVQARRFTSDGSPVGEDFQVNTYSPSEQRYPSIAMSAVGDFVVVWESYGSQGSDTDGFSIQGRRYDSSGAFVGGEFQINTYTTYEQIRPWVSMDPDGNFIVVWFSNGSTGTDTSSFSIQGRRFSSDGSPIGDDFQVNTYTTAEQALASVDLGSAGDFVVAWSSNGSGGTDYDGASIQMSSTTPSSLIFSDGFESGDLSAWSTPGD